MPESGPARAFVTQNIIDEISQLRRGHRLGLRVALIHPNGMIQPFDAYYGDQPGLTIPHALFGKDAVSGSHILQCKSIAIQPKGGFGSMDGIVAHLICDGGCRNEVIIGQRDACANGTVKFPIEILCGACGWNIPYEGCRTHAARKGS